MRMIRTIAVMCLAAGAFASVPATALDDPMEIGVVETVGVSADAFQAAEDVAIPTEIQTRYTLTHAQRLEHVVIPDAPAVASLRTCLVDAVSSGRPDAPSLTDPPVPRSVA